MNGKPYKVARFATTLRRQLFREHLGLIPPQKCDVPNEPVTSFMRCAPVPNQESFGDPYDSMVADPLTDATLDLWNDTARRNREIFTEVFRPVPTNLVRDWKAYDVRDTIYSRVHSVLNCNSPA
jgi:phospholipase D1/2